MPEPSVGSRKVGQVVLAGEVIEDAGLNRASKTNQVIIGPGLKKRGEQVVASKCGLLRSDGSRTYWVDALGKRYQPAKGESVVGIVTKKMGDYFKVDVRAADAALLNYTSFEGATKKNRPNVNIGDAVYGKMVVVSPDMEPELVCVNDEGRKENMGVLSGGFIFRTSLHLARKIRHPDCPLMSALGKTFKYECALGTNGVIWIKSNDPVTTIAVSNAILNAETMTSEEIANFSFELS